MIDLAYGAFVDLALSENGKKKMEALDKINEQLRGKKDPSVIHATIMPAEKPVNDEE